MRVRDQLVRTAVRCDIEGRLLALCRRTGPLAGRDMTSGPACDLIRRLRAMSGLPEPVRGLSGSGRLPGGCQAWAPWCLLPGLAACLEG